MNELEKKKKYQSLVLLYGSLLTPKQQEILEDYFANDLSLSEIGENHLISRSAVHDTLKKTLVKLDHYEATLHLAEKNHRIEELLSSISGDENKEVIEKIKEILDYGI